MDDAVTRGYKYGRVEALKQAKLPKDALPTVYPYSYDDMMTRTVELENPKPVRRKRR